MKLTIITKFALIHVVLTKREFLQIGICFCQQADGKHASPNWVQRCHCARRFWYCVAWRIDYDDWQRYGKYPNGLNGWIKESRAKIIRIILWINGRKQIYTQVSYLFSYKSLFLRGNYFNIKEYQHRKCRFRFVSECLVYILVVWK